MPSYSVSIDVSCLISYFVQFYYQFCGIVVFDPRRKVEIRRKSFRLHPVCHHLIRLPARSHLNGWLEKHEITSNTNISPTLSTNNFPSPVHHISRQHHHDQVCPGRIHRLGADAPTHKRPVLPHWRNGTKMLHRRGAGRDDHNWYACHIFYLHMQQLKPIQYAPN